MSTARIIEHQITRKLLDRRDIDSQQQIADKIIIAAALFAGVSILSLCLPQLLLPVIVTSVVFGLGV